MPQTAAECASRSSVIFEVMEPLGPYRAMPAPLAPPPRHIPWTVRVPLLLGGRIAQLGWVVILLGTFALWVNAPDFSDRLAYRHGRESATARVTAISCVQHPRHLPGDCSIWRADFSFAAGGQTRFEHSYSLWEPSPAGTATTALYPRGCPERARLDGMWRFRDHDSGIVPMSMLFAIGIGIVFFAARPGRRALVLLRRGAVTRGRLVDKQSTRARVNQQPIYRYTFEFEPDDGGKYLVSAQTHRDVLEDEPTEQVLYLREDPSFAIVLDHLPGGPHVAGDGTIAPRSTAPAVAYLVLAAIVVGFNAVSLFVALR